MVHLFCFISLTLSSALSSQAEFEQYSNYPSFTYGSSPALQAVGSEAFFTEVFWGGDYDQYRNIASGAIVQIENTNLTFDIEINSGAIISTNNAHEPGKTTITRVIKSVFCDPALPVTRYYIDKLTLSDNQTGIPKDTNSVWTTNTVTQKGFPQSGGGEG